MNARPLDIEHPSELVNWLRSSGLIQPNESPQMDVLPGGVSNRTVLVQRTGAHPDAWVIKQALRKLRVRADWFSDPIRVHREAAGLRWLRQLTPPGTIPRFVHEDHQHHLLIMEAVPQPHVNWKTELLAGRVDNECCRQFGSILGGIHRGSFERRREIRPVFAERTFFESLRLEPYYSFTAAGVPEAADFMQRLLETTRGRCLTLVHGDFSPKNILVFDGQLVLLDHEVIHWGDPAFDVGFGLTHLLSKAHHLSQYRSEFAAAAYTVWHSYRAHIGTAPWQSDIEQHVVQHTLACLLARVAGRSPLEYLDEQEQTVQRDVAVELMTAPPASVEELIRLFIERL